ncbi:MAG: 50S ribosomal protein L25 [Candidatus Kaiserbacteria bacterium]|nr:50S ribosomal protein L25 [Candidatus Kaiserbacteria bacterium]
MLTLSVEKRDKKVATLSSLRLAGSIPGVVYGAHQSSTPITLNAKAFAKILHEAGEATIVSLSGMGAALPTLIHEVSYDPLKGHPTHVDFYAVTKGEKVEVAIPLTFVGESPAVEAGANLVKVMHEVEVKADPMNLPHDITVDLSLLKELNAQIHVKDLVLPAGVELMSEPEDVVVLTQEVAAERVEEVSADIASIEVEKKGKEEEAAEEKN